MLSADRIQSLGDSSAGSAVRAYTKSRSSIRISTANSVLITREQPCPVHIAGSARRLVRSLMQRRRRLISCVVCSVSMFTSLAYDLRARMRLTGSAPFLQLSQEFVGSHKKRILLENAADDYQRMGPHDINYNISSELCEIVRTDDRVEWALELQPQIVRTRLIFQQVVNARSVFQRPLHMGNKPNKREPVLFRLLPYLLPTGKRS